MIEQVSLREIIDEDFLAPMIDTFSNKQVNKEVEIFLKHKAVRFEKQDISRTTLIIKGEELVGYFAIANKAFFIDALTWNSLSKTQRKKYIPDNIRDAAERVAPQSLLLGQIGKNFVSEAQISGQDLLRLAEEELYRIYQYGGGRYFWLECLNKDVLIEFYSSNGYEKFSESGDYCLMIKRIK